MSSLVLQADNLWKQYGISPIHSWTAQARRWLRGRAADSNQAEKIWALREVSFELNRGQTLGVIGENGAGKSTLLKVLCGVTNPTRGRVQVLGRTAPLIEVGAGFNPELSGRENIYFNAAILGMSAAQIRKKFDAIVAFSELEQFIDVPVKKYSSGMFVRLGFSVAIHTDADILLVDEVLSVGDIGFQRKCFEAIRAMLSRGLTLVLVSHWLSAIQAVCRRVLWLEHGQVRQDGVPDQVIAAYCQESERKYLSRQLKPADQQGIVRVERLVLRDSSGAATDTVASKTTIELELHYLAQERVARPYFWMLIESTQFGRLFGISNHKVEWRTPFIEGRGVMRALVPELPLMPGVYEIWAGICDETGTIPLAPSRILLSFQVVMTAPGRIGSEPAQTSLAFNQAPVIVPFEWLGTQDGA